MNRPGGNNGGGDLFGDLFGSMFDFNGDGKTDAWEAFAAYKAFEDATKGDDRDTDEDADGNR